MSEFSTIHISQLQSWRKFIKHKNLGIEVVYDSPFADNVTYKVINEKQWLLSRLKYDI